MIKFSFFMAAMTAFFVLSSGNLAVAQDGIMIDAPYARVSGASAKSGAVFMTILNQSAQDDRLVSATSDVAARVELHTHTADANGVMQMGEVPDGFAIASGDTHALDRGGDHIMLLGLTRALKQGDIITLTLTFAQGTTLTLEVPVDNARQPGADAAAGHGGHAVPATN